MTDIRHPDCPRCGEPVTSGQVMHTECQALGVVGHDYGVCRCTGWDTNSRDTARELMRRIRSANRQ